MKIIIRSSTGGLEYQLSLIREAPDSRELAAQWLTDQPSFSPYKFTVEIR